MASYSPGSQVPGGQRAPSESRAPGALWDSGGVTYEWTGSAWTPRGGGGGVSGGGISYNAPATPDYEALARRNMELQQQAVQPGITSYEAYKPVVQKGFEEERTRLEAEKEPIVKRYENLLAEVTGRQQQEEQRTGIATAQELGRRGIVGGGLYEQEINKALSPITQFYTGQAKEVGLSGEEAQRNLQNLIGAIPQQERESLWQVQNAIAQLQSGAGQTGVAQALQMYEQQRLAQQSAADMALRESIARMEQAGAMERTQYQSPYEQAQTSATQLAIEQSKQKFPSELQGATTLDFGSLYNQFNAPQTSTAWSDFEKKYLSPLMR